jgi:hypothetical protein
VFVTAAMLLGAAALAQDPDDGEGIDITNQDKTKTEEFGFAKNTTKIDLTVEDDVQMHDFVAEAAKKAPPPDRWHLDLMGKPPFADNYEIQLVAYDAKNLVVELPVLVSISKPQFAAEHPNGVVVVAEISSGATKVVQTQQVTSASVYDATPTLVFFKTALPTAASADVRFVIKVGDLPAPPPTDPKAKPAPAPAPPKDKFARTTVLQRP